MTIGAKKATAKKATAKKATAKKATAKKATAKKATAKKATAKKATAKKATAKKATARKAVPPTHDEIAIRAYEIYERRGESDGQPTEDWQQAKRELLAERGLA